MRARISFISLAVTLVWLKSIALNLPASSLMVVFILVTSASLSFLNLLSDSFSLA
jgi:hypothetical protein